MTWKPELFEELDRRQRQRYDDRLDEHGRSPRTLGWGSAEQMQVRFAEATARVETTGQSVLDIGCGFGDLLGWMSEEGRSPESYLGWDINPRLLEVAAKAHPSAVFEQRNLFVDPPETPVADLVFAIGVTSLRHPEIPAEEYWREFLARAFAAAGEALVFNGISSVRDAGYPEEDFISYVHPSDLLETALSLTPYVDVLHSGPSIPQREVTTILRRRPRR